MRKKKKKYSSDYEHRTISDICKQNYFFFLLFGTQSSETVAELTVCAAPFSNEIRTTKSSGIFRYCEVDFSNTAVDTKKINPEINSSPGAGNEIQKLKIENQLSISGFEC